MDVNESLNNMLVKLFNDIMGIEEKALITGRFKDITVNDMHIIEAVGMDEPKMMSIVAKKMDVTLGTLTIAMNKLVKKGYVNRERSEKDRRVVYASLTAKGKAAFKHHLKFHEEMIKAVVSDIDDSQAEVLAETLTKLDRYFTNLKQGD